MDDMLNLGINW